MRFTDASLARLPRWLAVTPLLILAVVTPFTALGAGTNGKPNDPASVALEVAPIGSPVLNLAVQALGTYEGECFPWVRRVVQGATGRQMGFGYRTGYLEAGAIEVPLDAAKPGDILQLIDDRDDGANADYPGMHTSIVLGVQTPGVFRVIDSNLAFDGVVRVRDDYNPVALAGRYPNINVHVYRFYEAQGGSANDVGFRGSFSTVAQSGGTPVQPLPGMPAIASTLGGGTLVSGGGGPLQAGAAATIRADGDCLRLRSAASASAPVLTCLPDGGSVTLLQGSVQADGVLWQSVSAGGAVGWVASQYLVQSGGASSAPAAAATAAPTVTATATPAPVVAAGPSSPVVGSTEGTSPAIIGDLPSGGGLALVVFSGGSTDSLLSTINQRRCSPVSVWASRSGGGLIGMIPGAPPMVNREWQTQFPSNSLEPRSPLIVVCGGAASTNAVSTSPAPAVSSAPGNRGSTTPPGPAGNE
ncbi:MAG: SH3 domain-containing protein [Dehalococcoidia bacterium]|nr:SH3 domain-containing protein [Dehalococcoidia bacterium]